MESEIEVAMQYLAVTDAMGYQAGEQCLSPEEYAEALRKDAERYRWLRAGKTTLRQARSILNDTPHGIDAAVDALMAVGDA